METVKGFANQEKEVFLGVTEARANPSLVIESLPILRPYRRRHSRDHTLTARRRSRREQRTMGLR